MGQFQVAGNEMTRVKFKVPLTQEEPQSKCTPEFDRFCADFLEEGSTTIDPTPAFELWQDWCSRRTIAHSSQKRFGGMMGERFKRDANNRYPRYIGVRAKRSVPILKVVSSH